MSEGGESPAISELSIGIRELFRIVVPGAYASLLFEWLIGSELIRLPSEGRSLLRIAISIFAGLIAYGLQVHEKWLPYRDIFELWRRTLNAAIVKTSKATNALHDYIGEYKYFIESSAPELRERIHYFSSFYYMLDEMSLISAIGAIVVVIDFFRELNPHSEISIYFLPGVAVVSQLLIFFWDYVSYLPKGFKKLKKSRLCVLRYTVSWVGILVVWVLWNYAVAAYFHRIWPRGPVFDVDWRFWGLITAAVIFERLGAKQWAAIIKEQVALVKSKKEDLEKIIHASSLT